MTVCDAGYANKRTAPSVYVCDPRPGYQAGAAGSFTATQTGISISTACERFAGNARYCAAEVRDRHFCPWLLLARAPLQAGTRGPRN